MILDKSESCHKPGQSPSIQRDNAQLYGGMSHGYMHIYAKQHSPSKTHSWKWKWKKSDAKWLPTVWFSCMTSGKSEARGTEIRSVLANHDTNIQYLYVLGLR